jgi:hypothetical protein
LAGGLNASAQGTFMATAGEGKGGYREAHPAANGLRGDIRVRGIGAGKQTVTSFMVMVSDRGGPI